MSPLVEQLNFFLALGGIGLFLGAAILIFDLYTSRSLFSLVQRFGMMLAAALSIAAVFLALVYSEVFGFVPCGLCWLQRVFVFPQAFIATTAVFIKDKTAALYGIVLAIPGLAIALYQHYIQMGGAEVVGCPTSGGDCSQRILFEFGFMTFPLLGASILVFLIALYWYIRKT